MKSFNLFLRIFELLLDLFVHYSFELDILLPIHVSCELLQIGNFFILDQIDLLLKILNFVIHRLEESGTDIAYLGDCYWFLTLLLLLSRQFLLKLSRRPAFEFVEANCQALKFAL